MWRFLVCFACSISITGPVFAGGADVVGVKVRQQGKGTYRFDVTLRHDDEGWDHYADRWQVVGKDGTVYASRVLAHPHVNEQPFTRSKSGVAIPSGISQVVIVAHDKVHGEKGKTMMVDLPDR